MPPHGVAEYQLHYASLACWIVCKDIAKRFRARELGIRNALDVAAGVERQLDVLRCSLRIGYSVALLLSSHHELVARAADVIETFEPKPDRVNQHVTAGAALVR